MGAQDAIQEGLLVLEQSPDHSQHPIGDGTKLPPTRDLKMLDFYGPNSHEVGGSPVSEALGGCRARSTSIVCFWWPQQTVFPYLPAGSGRPAACRTQTQGEGSQNTDQEGGRSISTCHCNALKVPKSLWFPGRRSSEATYLGRQAVADGVHVVGGRRRVHEAVRVAGEAVAGSVCRAGVGGRGGRSQSPLVHGGRWERLGPVHGAAPICGETQERA